MFTCRVHLCRTGRSPVVAFALAAALLAASPALGQVAKFDPPKRYYLALGDSITYGYQAWRARAELPPSGYDTGYVDVFGGRLRAIDPRLTIVNYGCPGESTTTFITGPCLWREFGFALHDEYRGSQLAAALTFLRAHPGQVSPITVTLWSNDSANSSRRAMTCRASNKARPTLSRGSRTTSRSFSGGCALPRRMPRSS